MWDEELQKTFWNKGASPKRFYFTYSDLMELTGLSYGTLQQYVYKKKLDPKKLGSVIEFVNKHKAC